MNEESKPRIVARWGEAGLEPAEAPTSVTERKLIDGTLECLRRDGLRGATSRAIAAAAGVNLGAITYHFGSKDELVAQALLRAIRSWVEPALGILRQDMDPVARMLASIEQLRATFEGAHEMLPVYLEALVAAPRHDTLRRGVADLMAEVRGFLTAQTAELRDAGFLPEWIDPEAMASLFIATADGLGLHAVISPGGADAERVAGQAIQLLLAARASGGATPLSPGSS
jgi:AcrR family transcriptional regulator